MQEIICVLDMSGSMQSFADDAKEGFNKFLEDQKKVGEAYLRIFWFDHQFKPGYSGKLSEAELLKEWPNGGMTSLNDAIGKTFAEVKDEFSKTKPEKVILAIQTDGMENNSKEFSKSDVANLIEHHQNKYAWDVFFLAADQDAWQTAQLYKIPKSHSIDYASVNTRDGFAKYSAAVTTSRTSY